MKMLPLSKKSKLCRILYKFFSDNIFFKDRSKTAKTLTAALLIITSFTIFIIQRNNGLQDNMHKYDGDEEHTVYAAISSTGNYRVGEGIRWPTRFFLPASLIYMNKYLGGDHYTEDWGLIGLKYYFSAFNRTQKSIESPGLQDFYYMLRFQYVFMFGLVFIFFILFYLYKENDYLTPFLLTIYLGGSSYLFQEQMIFYTDPLLTMMFIMGCFLLYSGTQRGFFESYSKKPLLLAFWYSFAVSVKLSAFFLFFIPLVIILYQKSSLNKKFEECVKFFGFSLLCFVFINITAFSSRKQLGRFIQDTTANFWHYAVGHEGLTVNAGWPHAKLILNMIENEFNILFYLFVPVVLYSFFVMDKRNRIITGTMLTIMLISLYSLTEQRVFLPRNIVPFIIFFLLLISTSLWKIYLHFKQSSRHSKYILLMIITVLTVDRFCALQLTNWGFYDTFNRSHEKAITLFKNLKKRHHFNISYSVGIDLEMNNHHFIENAPLLTHRSFQHYTNIWQKRIFKKNDHAIVIVKRVDRNFQLTNFILPKLGLKNKRFGNYFIFYHKLKKK